jgi:hypothetical protein
VKVSEFIAGLRSWTDALEVTNGGGPAAPGLVLQMFDGETKVAAFYDKEKKAVLVHCNADPAIWLSVDPSVAFRLAVNLGHAAWEAIADQASGEAPKP